MRGDVVGVAADALDHRGGQRVLEQPAEEVQPGVAGHRAALLLRVAAGVQSGQLDPAGVGSEPGAPDDVGHVQHAAVRERRPPVGHRDRPRHPLDPGRGQVGGLDPDQRAAVRQRPAAHRAAHRRAHGQHVPEGEHHQRGEQPGRPAVDVPGELTRVPAGQQDPVRPGQVQRDVRAGVAGADDQHVAVAQLRRVAVVARSELDDLRIQVGRERRDRRQPVVPGRDDHVVRLVPLVAGVEDVALPVVPQPPHRDAGPHRQLPPGRVVDQVVGELLVGRERPVRRRIRRAGQPVVPGRAEQPQRVPAVPPGVADLRGGLQDDERAMPAGQLVAHRQPRLAAAHDHGLEPLDVHGLSPPR